MILNMAIFDLFRRKKRLRSSYEDVWEKPCTPADAKQDPPEWKGASKKRKTKAQATRKSTTNSRQTDLEVQAAARAEALTKAKEIMGDKPFGLNTVKALEIPVEQRFEGFHRTIDDVVRGILPFAVVYGTAGVGKSWTVKDVLNARGLEAGKDYAWLTSKCTPPSLYETAITFRKGGILVLDDVDFKSGSAGKQMTELLKAMTDTQDERIVTWTTKGADIEIVNSISEAEQILERREKGEGKKKPSQFKFEGRIIVITNLTETEFDKEGALLSRALNVPLYLTEDEKLEHMRLKLRDIMPEMDLGHKEAVLNELIEYHTLQTRVNKKAGTDKLDQKQLDLRTLVQALKLAEVDDNWQNRLMLLF
jgi:hypothetical protein